MQSPVEQDFHDPVLKEAVCKCWACDCAPAHLKNRIANLLAKRRGSHSRISWMIWPVAIAALLLISFGLFNRFHLHPSAIAALPVNLETNLIATHDHCCSMPNHQHLKVPKDDDAAIADALHTQLQRAVLVYHPQDHAWLFCGAAICPVGSTPSGHLVFAKGTDHLSIFSLPKSVMPDATEGTDYSATVDQHSIVSFVKDNALFCIVGSGDVSIDDLKQMESKMEPAVAIAPAQQSARVELTELLRPSLP